MINDFIKALGNLRSGFALFLLFLCILATCFLFAITGWAAWALIGDTDLIQMNWLKDLLGGSSIVIIAILAWFTFPAFVTALAGLFLDPALARIEKKDYPSLAQNREPTLTEGIGIAFVLIKRAFFLNMLALPFYFVPILNIGVYFLVNSKLLAHDYFLAVMVRRMTLKEAEDIYKTTHWQLAKVGVISAAFFVIPVLNLLAPLLSVFMMLHFVMRLGLANAPSNMLPHHEP